MQWKLNCDNICSQAAITHNIHHKNSKVVSMGYHTGEFFGQLEGVTEPRKELSE
jgi:hypothetical protein